MIYLNIILISLLSKKHYELKFKIKQDIFSIKNTKYDLEKYILIEVYIMAKFCTNCGAKLDSGASFCTECGNQIPDFNVNNANAQTPNPTEPQVQKPIENPIIEGVEGNITVKNFVGENDNIIVLDEKGPFKVIEYEKDLSVAPSEAVEKYFSSKMKVRPRQLVTDLSKTSGIYMQAGAMQWMSGANKLSAEINGIGDFGKKFIKSTVTGETTAKPEYSGDGFVVSEQTYKHLLLLDMDEWDNSLALNDGLFLAAENSVELTFQRISNLSSALAALNVFYTQLEGSGYVCLESDIPIEELIVIELTNDTVTIDGSLAIAWTGNLQFSGEKSGKSIVDSAISQEGLVSVFRGTGKILMAPLSLKSKIVETPKPDFKL